MDNNLNSLFLSQSYLDSYAEYKKNLKYDGWDYIVITASNHTQKHNFECQIESRRDCLPEFTKFLVIADKGGRIGSGGATLNILSELRFVYGVESFADKRILLIHSGGDSKRIPQFSACGKLFSPVPRELNNGQASTLFDEFLIATSFIHKRINGGMLVMSGDVLLLFNQLQVDIGISDAVALSIKTNIETGKNHGVFLTDSNDSVVEFLHKKSALELMQKGAVDTHNNVEIDTGAVYLSPNIMESILSLVTDNGAKDELKESEYINSNVRLSFYADFLYPLANNSSYDNYMKEAGENGISEELLVCRKHIWDNLTKYTMKVAKLSPAEFIHFGTSSEYLELFTNGAKEFSYLNWSNRVNSYGGESASYCSYIDNTICGDNVLVENSTLRDCNIGNNVIISDLNMVGVTIPSDTVMHGIKTADGYIARIYDIHDNPKNINGQLVDALDYYRIDTEKVLIEDKSLWFANIYAISNTEQESIANSLILHRIIAKKASVVEAKEYFNKSRTSLCKSYNDADLEYKMATKIKIENDILYYNALEYVTKKEYSLFRKAFEGKSSGRLTEFLALIQNEPTIIKVRAKAYVAEVMKVNGMRFDIKALDYFDDIKKALNNKNIIIKTAKCRNVNIELPVRVNFGGGWTDTPPYCMENGGTVLNCAIKLNGQKPIKVNITKIDEKAIIIHCKDINQSIKIANTFEEISKFEMFSLFQACFIALGLEAEDIISKINGGMHIETDVYGIPRGSGLGTSSILSAGVVKALLEFFCQEYTNHDIYNAVLRTEQIMSTYGGWQDQVGGLTDEIKLITSKPSLNQDLVVENITLDTATKAELNERFALIYTGQRRLARNLLKEVMNRYILGKIESVVALKEIERLALAMKRELERGDIDEFANLLNKHWEYSKMLDTETTNTCIDQIFNVIESYLDGKMICGAGGGGFLQVILKKGITKADVNRRLDEVFGKNVSVWDAEIL